nr:LysM peptidoglycan-binding domain-containing protein [Anaerolineae bacterium]
MPADPADPPATVAGNPTPTEWNIYPPTALPTIVTESGRIIEGGLYTIQPGDTLWDISMDLGIPFEALIQANSDIDPDLLLPEDTIIIPGVVVEPGQPTATAAVSAEPTEPPDAIAIPPDGARLLLYEQPDIEAPVITLLNPQTPLYLVGRSPNSAWLQVAVRPAEITGWVIANQVAVFVELVGVPVTSGAVADIPSPTPIISVSPPPGATPAAGEPTATPQSLPTPTPTLPPLITVTPHPTQPGAVTEVDYPYISNITENARDIFRVGLANDNRPGVFSKVGDSITANGAFLVPIGQGNYNLREYSYLQPVVTYYSEITARTANSFANDSLSARGGWLVWHTILPQYANPDWCYQGETPLECEYRVVKPAVSLIMLGTNDVLTTPLPTYELGMRTVVETTLEAGVIPVLSTIPPFTMRPNMEGRVAEMNNLIISLTEEYDIPLWDYWSACQPLPNYGLAGDGVHPGWAAPADFQPGYLVWGMTTRNLTALQALDAVWRMVILPVINEG